jgi:hypothetical protein
MPDMIQVTQTYRGWTLEITDVAVDVIHPTLACKYVGQKLTLDEAIELVDMVQSMTFADQHRWEWDHMTEAEKVAACNKWWLGR